VESRMGVMVDYRLKVWLYEVIMAIALFVVAVACYRKLKIHAGDTAIVVFSLYGASQILLESMRDDGHMLLIFLRVGQLGAALLPIAACAILCRGESRAVKLATWGEVAVCVVGVALLEFSLDGRLTIGTPSLARDYSIMAVLCAVLAAHPCWMILRRKKG